MKGRRLQWQLFAAFAGVSLLVFSGLTWQYVDAMRGFHRDQAAAGLEQVARGLLPEIRPLVAAGRLAALRALCRRAGREAGVRITVILPGGRVAADSERDPATMDNHADRPEVMAALASGRGVAERYSHTLRTEMLYVAVAAPEGAVVVRAALPETSVRAALAGLRGRLLAVALAVLALALGASFLVARRISRPLENLRLGAQLFAEGALDYRLHVPDSEETRGLAAAMNAMAAQLGDRLETIRRQRNQTEAILSSMREGVVAVDADRRVITVNEAALRLFRRRAEDVCGRPIQEVLRNPYLQRFLGDVLHDGAPREGEMVLRVGGTERNLHLNGTILRDAAGRKIGAVAVLHDVTRLRRLEHLRRDFVANVSHELRTPVTSIRGFAETLLDEELDPAERRRFLEIVHRQAERLGDLVEDLLALSRIEREVEAEAVRLEPGPVAAVVQGAVEACRPAAKRRRVRLSAECPADLEASMEPRLLEQALVNLLDNAVKYSPEGGEVEVTAAREGGEVVVRVRDQGPGIPREHLPRIFERFYRVDKARSRELGGTGLGLAIVKHVMQAHGGRVTVESEPGKGSVFALHLPG